jgi:diguanylate cyclase (GGDEF)-like protein/PAS domain S-box-containing protein
MWRGKTLTIKTDSISRAAAAKIRRAVETHITSTGSGFVVCNSEWFVIWANAKAREMLGITAQEKSLFPKWSHVVQQNLPNDVPSGLIEIHRLERGVLHVFATCSVHDDCRVIQLTETVSLSRQLADMSYNEQIWKNAIESAGHGVWDYNSNNEVMFVSDTWKRMRGFPVDQPVRDTYENWIARLHPDDRETTIEHVRRHNSGEVKHFSFEYRERHADGHYVWIHCSGQVKGYGADWQASRVIGTDIDITRLKQEEQQRQEELEALHQKHINELEQAHATTEAARRIAHVLSRQDPLTQLPNRRVFGEEISNTINDTSKTSGFAVLIVDLDRFKPVNDLYGHAIGDDLITAAGKRLLDAAGETALVARLGGDEFGVLLPRKGTDLQREARDCADRMIESLETAFQLDELTVEIGASVGIALFPEDGRDHKTLFRHADMALYAVKQSRKGSHIFYSDSMGKAAEVKATLDAAVRRAVAEDAFEPFFQPIVDLQSNSITTFELLARWHHPTLGWVPPDQFIAIIEQSQLMPQFTKNILRKACMAANEWPKHISLSVNLSPREVCNLATPILLLRLLAEVGFPISRLRLEITEQALMKDMFIAKQVVAAVRRAGAKVSLDDFGAGYAGLGYLRELAFDSIKIDKSFVMTMRRQPESLKIVEAMQRLADNLGLETVAEGVEDGAALEQIRSIGCSSAQGYHFSRPVPAADVGGLLNTARQGFRKSA